MDKRTNNLLVEMQHIFGPTTTIYEAYTHDELKDEYVACGQPFRDYVLDHLSLEEHFIREVGGTPEDCAALRTAVVQWLDNSPVPGGRG